MPKGASAPRRAGIVFDIRPGEGRALGLLFTMAFFKGSSVVFVETAANAKFLTEFSISFLPYVFIANAGVAVVVGSLYTRCTDRLQPLVLIKGLLAVLISILLIFNGQFVLNASRWTAMALMIWKDVHWMLIEIAFWAVAGFLFNIRQSKRLFGFALSGDILSWVLSGLPMPWIAASLATEHLLLIAAAGTVLCLVTLFVIEQGFSHRFVMPTDQDEEAFPGLFDLSRDKYIKYLLFLTVLSMASYFFLDFIFLSEVQAKYTSEAEFAGFFGIFYATLGIANLVTGGLVTNRLLLRFGIIAGLLAMPAVSMVGNLAAATIAGLIGFGSALFWMLVGTRIAAEMAYLTILVPTFRITYQPLPPERRLRVQAVRESIVEPASIGLTGVLLLLLTQWLHLEVGQLIGLLLAVLVIQILVCFVLRQEYVAILTEAFERRHLSGPLLTLSDAASLAVLEKSVQSEEPSEVLAALRLLEDAGYSGLADLFARALDHPNPEVRAYVLDRAESLRISSITTDIARLAEAESEARVRGAALQALATLTDHNALERVLPYLDDCNSEVRKGAMVGLLRSGGIEGVLAAGAQLLQMCKSADPHDRMAAAEILGNIGVAGFYRPLLELIEDADPSVRRAALEASGKIGNPVLVAPIVHCLDDHRYRESAMHALIRMGDSALPDMVAWFEKAETSVRIRLLRVMGRISSTAALERLFEYLDRPDRRLRRAALGGLVAAGFQAKGHKEQVQRLIEDEARYLTTILAYQTCLYSSKEVDLVVRALIQESAKARERILLLLSLILPTRVMDDARAKLLSDRADSRAVGLEIIDNIAPRNIRARVLPLLDELSGPHAVPEDGAGRPGSLDRMSILADLMTDNNRLPWTRATAIYEAGQARDQASLETLLSLKDDLDPLVRETAAWALGGSMPEHPLVSPRG